MTMPSAGRIRVWPKAGMVGVGVGGTGVVVGSGMVGEGGIPVGVAVGTVGVGVTVG